MGAIDAKRPAVERRSFNAWEELHLELHLLRTRLDKVVDVHGDGLRLRRV